MVLHMLAVFGREASRPPIGLEIEHQPHRPLLSNSEVSAQEASTASIIERAYSACKAASRRQELLGRGTAFCFDPSPYVSYSVRDGVHVLFAGEVGEWPGGVQAVDAAHDAFLQNSGPLEANDAAWLQDYYGTFRDHVSLEDAGAGEDSSLGTAVAQRALECLAQIKGSYAFVVYDSVQHRVLAGRDTVGSQPLYWGSNAEGQLLFGTSLLDLEGCTPTATHFPAGTLFASERQAEAFQPGALGWVINDEELPGQLLSFVKADSDHWRAVKAIPRITSKGVISGAVYRVSSKVNVQ